MALKREGQIILLASSFRILSSAMRGVGVSMALWGWEILSETDETAGGGSTALLGPGEGLAASLGVVLDIPAYLAMIARRFARRAASVASTDASDVVSSNSTSCGGTSGGGFAFGADTTTDTGRGLCLGEILQKKVFRHNLRRTVTMALIVLTRLLLSPNHS